MRISDIGTLLCLVFFVFGSLNSLSDKDPSLFNFCSAHDCSGSSNGSCPASSMTCLATSSSAAGTYNLIPPIAFEIKLWTSTVFSSLVRHSIPSDSSFARMIYKSRGSVKMATNLYSMVMRQKQIAV